MKTHYKANFSFTFTGHAGFILPCPAILQDRAFFKNLALPWSRAGQVALSWWTPLIWSSCAMFLSLNAIVSIFFMLIISPACCLVVLVTSSTWFWSNRVSSSIRLISSANLRLFRSVRTDVNSTDVWFQMIHHAFEIRNEEERWDGIPLPSVWNYSPIPSPIRTTNCAFL